MTEIMRIENISKVYRTGDFLSGIKEVQALKNVELSLRTGEIFAVVGESGCGKSTLARLMMGMEPPTEGKVQADLHGSIQMIFQDPYASLNPRKTIAKILSEPLDVRGQSVGVSEKVRAICSRVKLPSDVLTRYPHMLSGGQLQRVSIARALLLEPKILICDEPVSALDVSVQAQVLDLILEIKQELGLTIVFISHDLNLVEKIADRVGVFYLGRLVELADTAKLFKNPQHPYTQLLLSSSPELFKKKLDKFEAQELPSPYVKIQGCVFQSRCPKVFAKCREQVPEEMVRADHRVACFLGSP